MEFPEKLYELRKGLKLSQEELAGRIGVSRQAVQKWEAGASSPDVENLLALSECFGVTLDYLLKDGASSPEPEQAVPEAPVYVNLRWRLCYEYKSKRTLFGLPLVHINVGFGMRRAKGVLAIGNIATGLVAVGMLSAGVVSVGILAFGLLAFAAFAAGGIAVGGVAAGLAAVGGLAFGLFAVGGLACGIYAVGGAAFAADIALGGYANGHIAIGETVRGAVTFSTKLSAVTADEAYQTIVREFPGIWTPLAELFAGVFGG